VVVQCEICSIRIEKLPSKLRRHNFCGVECRETWQRTSGYSSGSNNATWRGGTYTYRGPNWDRQRVLALQRDKHTCQGCGSTKRLQVHHIVPFVTFDTYRRANELKNLKTLCCSCHKKEEWKYWRANPQLVLLYPDTRRIHKCRKCGIDYLAGGARSLDCDNCARGKRRSKHQP